MGTLRVRCKSCSNEINTGIGLSFGRMPVLGEHEYTCPACGATHEYHHGEFFMDKSAASTSR